MTALAPEAARRVLLLLTATRWLPVGLTVAIVLLRPLEQGLTVTQVLTLSAIGGVVTVALELPTSGFADAFGRRSVLVAAAGVNVVAAVLFVLADDVAAFLVVAVLTGVFRALDSGPLEAWYVDTVHVHRPGADVDQELSAAGTVLGASIALGALVSGLLVWWAPLDGVLDSPLTLPLVLTAALGALHLVALLVLLREPPRATDGTRASRVLAGVRAVPAVVVGGLGVLRRSRALVGLLVAEAALALAMLGFESMVPLRLAELLGSTDEAGALMGVTAAVGWAVFAGGATLGGWLSRLVGVTRAAVATHVAVALGVVVIGLATGPVGLLVGYLAAYGVFGGVGPLHGTLVHREADASNRATVMSLGSMVSFGVFAAAAPLTGLLSRTTSTGLAVLVLGGLCLLGALAYRPARAAEQRRTLSAAAAR